MGKALARISASTEPLHIRFFYVLRFGSLTDHGREFLDWHEKLVLRRCPREITFSQTPLADQQVYVRVELERAGPGVEDGEDGRNSAHVTLERGQFTESGSDGERFVRSIKSECVEQMIFFSEAALLRALSTHADHYHQERNHQGVESRILEPGEEVGQRHGRIECHQRLGGLLRYYHRRAAS